MFIFLSRLYNVPVADVRWRLTCVYQVPGFICESPRYMYVGYSSLHCLHFATCHAYLGVISTDMKIIPSRQILGVMYITSGDIW